MFGNLIWYDRVYLCCEDANLENPDTCSVIKGFNCVRFDSYFAANAFIGTYKTKVRHAMIPVCKWVPTIFDHYVLNWKLKKMFWGGKITIGRGYNKYNF